MKIKLFLTLPILTLAIFGVVFAMQANALPAGTYFWGGTTDNLTPHAYTGAGTFDASRVDVPSTDEDITGYAWGGYGYGWLSFEDADVEDCPIAGTCYSKRAGSNLVGWARMLDIKNVEALGNSGGWSGWVQLDGVTIDATNNLQGYAWSNELGFIQFAGASVSTPSLTLRYFSCSRIDVENFILNEGSSKIVVACDGTTDVTTDPLTLWSETGDDVVTVQDTMVAGKTKKKIIGIASSGTETVSAVYNSTYSDSVDITGGAGVFCTSNGCGAKTCMPKECYNGCRTEDGTKACKGFREVAP